MAQIGNHISKSEASIQSVTALTIVETENFLTDRLKARHQREHKDVRYSWIQEQVRDEDFSIKKGKNYANVGTKPIFASVLQCCSKCKIGILQDCGSHTPLQDEGEEPRMDLVNGCSPSLHVQTRYEHRGLSTTQKPDAESEKPAQKQKQKQTVVSVDR